MNIFAVDKDPRIAARSLCDRHVVKMATESVQILSSVLEKCGLDHPCKSTKGQLNSPLVKWVEESVSNYMWLLDHAEELFAEYTRRYCKVGLMQRDGRLAMCDNRDIWNCLPLYGMTPFRQVVPDEFKNDSAIAAYRNYYSYGRVAGFATWKSPGKIPHWYKKGE